jgi:hypothetical protein
MNILIELNKKILGKTYDLYFPLSNLIYTPTQVTADLINAECLKKSFTTLKE